MASLRHGVALSFSHQELLSIFHARVIADVRSLIEHARDATARAVNSALVLLYWSIGDRIRRDILKEKRADYGAQILGTVSQELVADFGNGYSVPNLSRMRWIGEIPGHWQVIRVRYCTSIANGQVDPRLPGRALQ